MMTAKYRMPDGSEAQVETLCRGQQLVGYGIREQLPCRKEQAVLRRQRLLTTMM